MSDSIDEIQERYISELRAMAPSIRVWWDDLLNSQGDERAWKLCQQYIDRRVSGVFFAALELTPTAGDVNQRIVEALDAARIPVVLLDRPVVPYPRRTLHDLVGIDNRRAGFIVTEHLTRLGCRRIAFIAPPNAAATVDAREAGYREALYTANLPIDRALMLRMDPESVGGVAALMKTGKPDGIVCANDRSAARLMQALAQLGFSVPRDVRVVGIDDVDYAALLPVRLTTLRQPTRQIGDAALTAMLERIERPDLAPREILLPCELIVRASCGALRAR